MGIYIFPGWFPVAFPSLMSTLRPGDIRHQVSTCTTKRWWTWAQPVAAQKQACEFITDVNKQSAVCCVRARTPSQHASSLLKLQTVDFSFIYDICDTQLAF